jgi:serine/threonine-protein kinase RsbW
VHASVRLAPVPESAAKARAFVEGMLSTWGCREMIDDARVVVTELVSNVVRHAHTDVWVDVDLVEDRIRIDVVDHADGDVALRSIDPTSALGGRGLRLVDELSERWGVDRQPGGKRVWAEWQVAHARDGAIA